MAAKRALTGKKFDDGKARFDLVPPIPIEELAKLYSIGASKYGERNWESGMQWGRIFAAMLRHAFAWARGERIDPVDGQAHLISVVWNAITLYEYERRKLGKDDIHAKKR